VRDWMTTLRSSIGGTLGAEAVFISYLLSTVGIRQGDITFGVSWRGG
jgi:hypothetical protein